MLQGASPLGSLDHVMDYTGMILAGFAESTEDLGKLRGF
jgi:hypothetical protein